MRKEDYIIALLAVIGLSIIIFFLLQNRVPTLQQQSQSETLRLQKENEIQAIKHCTEIGGIAIYNNWSGTIKECKTK